MLKAFAELAGSTGMSSGIPGDSPAARALAQEIRHLAPTIATFGEVAGCRPAATQASDVPLTGPWVCIGHEAAGASESPLTGPWVCIRH